MKLPCTLNTNIEIHTLPQHLHPSIPWMIHVVSKRSPEQR